MRRMMVPLGLFVAACRHSRRPSRGNVQCFTLTAYDPVMGQYIAMGHSSPVKLEGQSLYHADGEIPTEGDEVVNVVPAFGEMVGIVTRQAPIGVSGPFYGQAGAAMLTYAPKVGKARLMTDLLPRGGMDVEIISVSAGGAFSFKAEAGKRCVKGMSGSPIVQGGCLVGVLWGQSKQYEGRAVEAMADRLLDAWANEPEQNPQKRIRKASNRTIRREIRNITQKVAEAQAEAVGKLLGPEAAEQVRQVVEKQGVAAGTAAIKALKEADGK